MGIDPVSIAITVALNAATMAMTASRTIEGPRLKDLSVTVADYGTPMNYFYGRRRLNCPAFYAEPIKEVKKKRKGKGGKYKEYQYYGTFAVAIADHVIEEIVRVWADKHLVYDQTKAGPRSVFADVVGSKIGGNGANTVRLYYGTETQEPDPRMVATIEAAEGVDTTPAYRGVAYLMFEDLPLEKFGNRLPQVSVEAVSSATYSSEIETTDLNDSNTPARLVINPLTRELIRISYADEFGNMWVAGADNLNYIRAAGSASAAAPGADWNYHNYAQVGTKNSEPLAGWDRRTGVQLFEIGDSTTGLTDYVDHRTQRVGFVNTGNWIAMTDLSSGATYLMHYGNSTFEAFSILAADSIPRETSVNTTISSTSFVLIATSNIALMPGGTPSYDAVIPDHDRGCYWMIVRSTSTFDIYLVQMPGTGGALAGQITRNGVGATFPGSGGISGWAINRKTGHLLLSDGSTIVRYDPETDTVEATSSSLASFSYGFNWWTGDYFGYASGTSAVLIKTDDLSLVQSVTTTELNFRQAATWDDQASAIIWTTDDGQDKIKRISMNIIGSAGELLSSIIEDISTRSGIEASQIDASAVTATVQGYSWTQGTGKAILGPLLEVYDVDARPHDFGIEFLPRGS